MSEKSDQRDYINHLALTARAAPDSPKGKEALAELYQLIVDEWVPRLARGRKWRKRIRQELEDAANETLYCALKTWDPSIATFKYWCKSILRNRRIDILRGLRREPVSHDALIDDEDTKEAAEPVARPARDDAAPEMTGQISDHVKRLRGALDAAARHSSGRKRSRGAVDFYAVLLIHIRLALWARMVASEYASDPGLFGPGPVDVVEDLVPWHPADRRRRIRPELPTVEEIWDQAASALKQQEIPAPLTAEALCDMLHSHCPAVHVKPNTWQQWVSRARTRFVAEMPDVHRRVLEQAMSQPMELLDTPECPADNPSAPGEEPAP